MPNLRCRPPFWKEGNPLKFLHLADLHLGKNVCGFSMLEDQRYILSQILQICDGQKPDAVLLAGDIYDRALPPADAVQLLDWFLTELHRRNLPVFLISGNHDSAERLEFGAALMEQSNIYISHPLADTNRAYTRNDEFGPVHIWLLPFLRPGDVRAAFGEDAADVHSYEEAVQFVLDRFPLNPSERNVLVAHQFVLGSERSDSEDASIGTIDAIPGNLFRDFDYVALGHIHKPQNMGRGIRYPGTPLKYAFSEIHQQKSATLVTLGPKGSLDLNTVPLRPFREMKEVRGTYEEVTDLDGKDEDYVRIVLTEEQDIPNAVNKLRLHYPHLMELDYDNTRTRSREQIDSAKKIEDKTPQELFAELFEAQNGRPMSEEQENLLQDVIKSVWKEGASE